MAAAVESSDGDRAVAFTIQEEAGERLDRVLVERLPDLTRSAVQRLIHDGHATVDGRPVKHGYKLRPGEQVQVTIPPARPTDLTPEPIPLDVVYEDAAPPLNKKPKGLGRPPPPGPPTGPPGHRVVAPRGGEPPRIGCREPPGIVHRLDRDTSG